MVALAPTSDIIEIFTTYWFAKGAFILPYAKSNKNWPIYKEYVAELLFSKQVLDYGSFKQVFEPDLEINWGFGAYNYRDKLGFFS